MNNDLISRSELKEVIETYKPIQITSDYLQGKNNMIDYCIAEIEGAPTVESEDNAIQYTKGYQDGFLEGKKLAEIPQGEWGKWVISEIRCPECLEYYDPDCYSKEELNKCPNCGADMRKGESE